MSWILMLGNFSFAMVLVFAENYQSRKMVFKDVFQSERYFWLFFTIAIRGILIPKLFIIFNLHAMSNGFVPMLNLSGLPFLFQMIAYIVILDLFFFLVHWHFHRIPILWKMHSVHHSSTSIHSLSGFKQSLPELILHSFAFWGFGLIAGAQTDVLLAANSLFMMICVWQHSNLKWPLFGAGPIRFFFITPSDHKIHHELLPDSNHKNLGFLLTIWDRAAGSYSARQNPNAQYGINSNKYPLHSLWKQIFFPLFK